mmetsp:Transcript_46460/g.86323  ORF Transcript_46460/g.86323 Transcript_46460/m.86323 type:complete len:119 (-) Transcript_46460:619-975(-)
MRREEEEEGRGSSINNSNNSINNSNSMFGNSSDSDRNSNQNANRTRTSMNKKVHGLCGARSVKRGAERGTRKLSAGVRNKAVWGNTSSLVTCSVTSIYTADSVVLAPPALRARNPETA